jgi:hypothetical protein
LVDCATGVQQQVTVSVLAFSGVLPPTTGRAGMQGAFKTKPAAKGARLCACVPRAAYRKLAGKELAEDATFELERKRNRPEKYDRDVMSKTIDAMQRIEEIRVRRQERFYEKRMKVRCRTRRPLCCCRLSATSASGRRQSSTRTPTSTHRQPFTIEVLSVSIGRVHCHDAGTLVLSRAPVLGGR